MELEVIKADKKYRDLIWLTYALLTLAIIVAVRWLIPMGMERMSRMGWHELLVTLRWLLPVILICPTPAAIYLIRVGMKTLEHDQYPSPGRKVMFDTVVVRGAKARGRGKALIALGTVFLVLMVLCVVYTWARYSHWLNDPIIKKYLFPDSAVVMVVPDVAGLAAGAVGRNAAADAEAFGRSPAELARASLGPAGSAAQPTAGHPACVPSMLGDLKVKVLSPA